MNVPFKPSFLELSQFESMPLESFFNVKDPLAAKREEFKFLVPLEKISSLLEVFAKTHFLSTYGNESLQNYHNLYFDTPNFLCFKHHRQGKFNRLKVRVRTYVSSTKESFLEIKRKVKGRSTEKNRIEAQAPYTHQFHLDFFKQKLEKHAIEADQLEPVLEVSYQRLFLISKDFSQRVSLDFNIEAKDLEGHTVQLAPDFAVLEIKDRHRPKELLQKLKVLRVQPGAFSKYCLALCLLKPGLAVNAWKQLLKRVNPATSHVGI